MRIRTDVVVLAGLAVALAGVAGAAERNLEETVRERLAHDGLMERSSIEVTALEGDAVALSGIVTSLADARRALREAEEVAGRVESRLILAVPERTDREIEKDVHRAILSYVRYTVFDSIAVAVLDGHVRLEGSVYAGNRSKDIEERVAGVPGVRSLTSKVTVQPASTFDERLRVQLARGIYGGDRVIPIAGANPPVRIVVDRGHVTLTGYVNSRVDQMRLGIIARETLALSVDNQVRLDGDSPREPVKAPTI